LWHVFFALMHVLPHAWPASQTLQQRLAGMHAGVVSAVAGVVGASTASTKAAEMVDMARRETRTRRS